MTGVLDRIFATKRREVEDARERVSAADLRAQIRDAEPVRGFRAALEAVDGLALIAEVKKASPSRGVIRADFDPVRIAEIYVENGATAISVLTDAPYFQGSPEYLRAIRAAVAVPLLRKDFVHDPYQVLEARAWGADAVLLIAAALNDATLCELSDAAEDLGMDVLLEVHSEEETDRALALGATLIGVNNRDLATFSVALEISERLIPRIAPHATAVSESALETAEDLHRVQQAGAKAVLIGTTFCAAPDIGAKMREVFAR